jgi:hypothetical protein
VVARLLALNRGEIDAVASEVAASEQAEHNRPGDTHTTEKARSDRAHSG